MYCTVQCTVMYYRVLYCTVLQVLDQTVKLLSQSDSAQLVEAFRSEVTPSIDGVIRDLGSDPATKTTARDLKSSLNSLEGGEEN